MRYSLRLTTALLFILFTGCSFYGTQRGPTEWHTIRKPSYEIPPYAKYLEGLTFCLDPGHGGQAHLKGYKRGPTGVREAEMNLRLANYLKGFLEEAGAKVILTRTDDSFISLADRAAIANEAQVDVFISIHHNAHSRSEVNYPSVWYHGDADFRPVNLDIARHLVSALTEYARLPMALPNPLMSDYLMYPAGFGVLRRLEVPGVLLEGSFFSNPKEEKLLSKPEYNKLFSYAYFVGLAQWAYGGIPEAGMTNPEPNAVISEKRPTIEFEYSDGLHEREAWMLERHQVFTESVNLYLDGEPKSISVLRKDNRLRYTPEQPLKNGKHRLRVSLQNMHGNHNLPKDWHFTIAPPADSMEVKALATRLPADSRAYVKLLVAAWDADGKAIADGDSIKLETSYGVFENSVKLAKDGRADFYLHAGEKPGKATVVAQAGNAKDSIQIAFVDDSLSIFEGEIGTDSTRIAGAEISIDTLELRTDEQGHFFTDVLRPGTYQPAITRTGYWGTYPEIRILPGRATVLNTDLEPVANGIFHERLLVIDPRYGGSEVGTMINDTLSAAQVNLSVARHLSEILTAAGAEVRLLRTADVFLPVQMRVDSVNNIEQECTYLRINVKDYKKSEQLVEGLHYPGSRWGSALAEAMANNLLAMTGDSTVSIHSSRDPEIHDTKFTALGFEMGLINHPVIGDTILQDWYQWQIAYQLYQGILGTALQEDSVLSSAQIKIKDGNTEQPVIGFPVKIAGNMTVFTDAQGTISVPYLNNHPYRVEYWDAGRKMSGMIVPGEKKTIVITK